MADLTSKLASLNPFGKSSGDKGDDAGDEIGLDSYGSGHSSRHPLTSHGGLRVSHALKSFLAYEKVLSETDAGIDSNDDSVNNVTPALKELLDRPIVKIPAELLDRSHPLPEYFVSSSHNTYLIAKQLYGTSSASGYDTALRTGSRCVEIDAWDNEADKDEPKVTHGYTLVSHIPFRTVCETIRAVLDEEIAGTQKDPSLPPVAPIMISLENHTSLAGQARLVAIAKEVFGEHLLEHAVNRDAPGTDETGQHVPLDVIGPKIAFMIEYHLSDERESSDSDSSDEEDDHEEKQARESYKNSKKNNKKNKQEAAAIIPELAALGVYAQSVKPANNSWFDPGKLINGPHHHLINVSESGLSSHLPHNGSLIAKHNAKHLMRVFPKGTRISSSNMKPVPYWAIGAQVCALNWQHFGTSNQLNAALFEGSEGYVLKPAALRVGGSGDLRTGRKKKLRLRIAGATDIPVPSGKGEEAKTMKPYVTCSLYHPDDLKNEPPKRKTEPYKHHKLGFLHSGENPPSTDPIWDETLEWEYDDNELVFLRMMIKSDDSWAKNPIFALSVVRLSYVQPGWRFVRLLDTKGRESNCTLLVKFDFEDA